MKIFAGVGSLLSGTGGENILPGSIEITASQNAATPAVTSICQECDKNLVSFYTAGAETWTLSHKKNSGRCWEKKSNNLLPIRNTEF